MDKNRIGCRWRGRGEWATTPAMPNFGAGTSAADSFLISERWPWWLFWTVKLAGAPRKNCGDDRQEGEDESDLPNGQE